jgi:hypothetical protein
MRAMETTHGWQGAAWRLYSADLGTARRLLVDGEASTSSASTTGLPRSSSTTESFWSLLAIKRHGWMSYRWRIWRDRERLEKRRWSRSETSSRTTTSSCSLPRRTEKGTMQGIMLGVFSEIEEESERSDVRVW